MRGGGVVEGACFSSQEAPHEKDLSVVLTSHHSQADECLGTAAHISREPDSTEEGVHHHSFLPQFPSTHE